MSTVKPARVRLAVGVRRIMSGDRGQVAYGFRIIRNALGTMVRKGVRA